MKKQEDYHELLKPFLLKHRLLKNRIVFAPMSTQLANTDGSVGEKMLTYYADKAKGGAAVIITETFHVDNRASRFTYVQPSIYHDRFIPGLSNLADEIRRGGALAIAQIGHAGRQTTYEVNNCQPVAPSMIKGGPTEACKELTKKEIHTIVYSFAEAAYRAQTAGFDGIEIHGGNGYLINEFLSPYTNRREDEYGRDRALFLLKIIHRVKEVVNKELLIGVRIGFCDFIPGGLEPEDAVKACMAVPEADVCYIHTSAGTIESDDYRIQPMYHKRAILKGIASELKKVSHIPVILTGSVNSPALAQKLLSEKRADLIGMGRPLLADPMLPNKIAMVGKKEVRPCIRCNQGCLDRVRQGNTIKCSVNPCLGYEYSERTSLALKKQKTIKKILIAGAGPAGVTAALRCDELGFQVKLYEAESQIGGLLNTAQVEDFKEDIRDYLSYLKACVKNSGVYLTLSQKVDPTVLEHESPDIFIDATGSVPVMPTVTKDVPFSIVDVRTVLKHLDQYINDSKEIIVIGGGSAGCELGYTLFQKGKKVSIIEKLDDVLLDIDPVSSLGLKRLLERTETTIYKNTQAAGFDENGVITNKNRTSLHADMVVIAMGSRPNREIDQYIDRNRWIFGKNYLPIGDAKKVGRLYEAINVTYWEVDSFLTNHQRAE